MRVALPKLPKTITHSVLTNPKLGGVTMTLAELEAWRSDPRHRLASTATGLQSLALLPALLKKPRWTTSDKAFARKVLGFNRRHIQQVLDAETLRAGKGGFGTEVEHSGWSKRGIALRNWGHDPSSLESPLYDADQSWLTQHDARRRRSRRPNPEPTGNCYQSAADWLVSQCIFDAENCNYTLVHGEVQGGGHLQGITFGHAWIEFTDEHGVERVHDPEQGLWDLPLLVYYGLAGIDHRPAHQNTHRYTYREASKKMVELEHYGPWDLVTTSGY